MAGGSSSWKHTQKRKHETSRENEEEEKYEEKDWRTYA